MLAMDRMIDEIVSECCYEGEEMLAMDRMIDEIVSRYVITTIMT